MAKTVDARGFELALQEIIDEVGEVAAEELTEGIKIGVRTGASLWRKHANERIGKHEYKRSGETYTTGMYARSITSHMVSTDKTRPAGEVGSRKLAGLSHLLQYGHARVGGGRKVPPVLQIDKKVAPQTFEATIEAVEEAMDKAFR